MRIVNQDLVASEVSRIRAEYVQKDGSVAYRGQYAAFEPLQLGYHFQQLQSLAQLLQERGRKDLSGIHILDFGCGSGRFLGDLLGLGAEPKLLCGVDLMPGRLAEATRKYPQIEFKQIDGKSLPFSDSSFDVVSQCVVFSSIALPELRRTMAQEMRRVLKPGGYIFWWDLGSTVEEAGRQPLEPSALFPGWPVKRLRVSWLPKPSEGLAKRRWKYSLGWFVDLFAARPTHLAALIGPKPMPGGARTEKYN